MNESDRGVAIADVLYTASDETFYVLRRYGYQALYEGGWLEDVIGRLKADGWSRCGYVARWDGVAVALWCRKSEYLAAWDRVLQPERKSREA